MPYMLKRLTGVKFHAKELLKREAINVFTEIWVSPFTREICPHSRVKSPPFYILLLTGASRYVDRKNDLQKRSLTVGEGNYNDASILLSNQCAENTNFSPLYPI